MVAYATRDDVRARLNVDNQSGPVNSATLDGILEACSRVIDRWCQRADNGFVGQVQTRSYDVGKAPDGTGAVPVTIDPLLAVTAVNTDDGSGTFATALSATDYQLLPLNAPQDSRPWRQLRLMDRTTAVIQAGQARLQITGTFGEAVAVPAVIKEVAIRLAARWARLPDAPFGMLGSPDTGFTRVPKMDPDIEGLLVRAGYVDQSEWVFA